MKLVPKKGSTAHGMNRTIPDNHPGLRIHRKNNGLMEKILLALIAGCLFLAILLSYQG